MSLLSSSNLSHKMEQTDQDDLEQNLFKNLDKVFEKKRIFYGYSFLYIPNFMDQFCQCELQNQLKDAATSLKWFCNSLLVG